MIARVGDSLQLSGRLTMETVAALYDTSLAPDSGETLLIDMAKIEALDSAAVSLLLSWQRRAQRNNIILEFSYVPPNLLSLARLYGVAEILKLDQDKATGKAGASGSADQR